MSEEFEAFEPSGTRTVSSHSPVSLDSTAPLSPDHPLSYILPTLTPTRVSFHRRTTRMAVHNQRALSLGITEEVSGTSKLILDTDSEGDELGDEDTEEDEEDESLFTNDERESHGLDDEGHGVDEEPVLEEHQQAVLVVEIAASEPLRFGYGALRGRELAVEENQVPSTFEVCQSSRSVPERQGAERVSAFRQPTLVTWVDLDDDRVYTDIPAYAPPAALVQTPPSPEWSLGSLPVSPSLEWSLDRTTSK
nr:hypothetical protein [Tanacetum cinerariifolium]